VRYLLPFLVALLAVTLCATPARPCSRVLWNDSGRNVLVGRNMDWFEDMKSNIWVLPRGMKRDGLAAKNPLKWTSEYGSLIVSAYDVGTADGVNEKGLAVHYQYLPETEVGKRDETVPGLCMSLWAQYYLDRFATVADAVKALKTEPYQLRMAVEPSSKKAATVHLAINDATGDSAILQCIKGELKVYHSREYTVMTNSPTFDKQLENLKQYKGFGGEKPLPGSNDAADRFVRGAHYIKTLPKPKSDREAVASLLSVMRNVSQPFRDPEPGLPSASTTIWRTVTDLTDRVLFYDSVVSPQIFWVDLKKLKFDEGESVRKLTVVGNFDLMGEVSEKCEKAELFKFLPPEKE
jgi:penicillin V acylase-like amidase (Ntn superfamily)